MPDESHRPEVPPSQSPLHLNVLPSSGKVDQLREEFKSETKQLNHQTPIDAATDASISLEQRLLKGRIIAALQTVYDPELPVNIFDLGLIYEIRLDDKNHAHVKMTLTAPGCPVAGSLPAEIQKKVESVPGVSDSTITLVWDPPWDKSRMSEAAILELGF